MIDDEPSVQDVVCGYLEREGEGYLVYLAGNGADGLALAERMKPVGIEPDDLRNVSASS